MAVEPSKPGIRRCMQCRWLFVSPDELRIGRCQGCKQGEDTYTPRVVSSHYTEPAGSRSPRDTS